MLKYVKQVYVTADFNILLQFINLIKAKKGVKILYAKRGDYQKDYPDLFPLDLKNMDQWSTFDRGYSFVFSLNKKGGLHADVTVWDDKSYGFLPRECKFKASINVPISFIDTIADYISSSFNIKCTYEYEDYLQEQKKLWIENRKTEILK